MPRAVLTQLRWRKRKKLTCERLRSSWKFDPPTQLAPAALNRGRCHTPVAMSSAAGIHNSIVAAQPTRWLGLGAGGIREMGKWKQTDTARRRRPPQRKLLQHSGWQSEARSHHSWRARWQEEAEVNQRIRFFRVALIIRLFVRPWAWLPLFQQHSTSGPYSSIDGLKFLFNSRVYKVQTSPHCIRGEKSLH
jgi:hypothetical protein